MSGTPSVPGYARALGGDAQLLVATCLERGSVPAMRTLLADESRDVLAEAVAADDDVIIQLLARSGDPDLARQLIGDLREMGTDALAGRPCRCPAHQGEAGGP